MRPGIVQIDLTPLSAFTIFARVNGDENILILKTMARMVLEVNEAIVERWNSLSPKRKKELTRQIEELVLQPFLNDNEDVIVSESESVYEPITKKKQQKMNELKRNINSISSEGKSLSKVKNRQRIETLTAPLLLDLSKFKFDRNEANDYE